MQEKKRYYRWCMYGDYHPDFDLESRKSILSRLRGFFASKCVTHRPSGENRSTGLKQGKFGKIGGATLLIFLFGMLFVGGCRTQQIPVESKTEIRYVDSVVLKDSVIVIPIEQIVDIVPWYDTLHLETTISWSDAWVDTNYHILQGRLVNKQGKIVEIKYVDRVRVRDSLVVQEKPIYVTDTVETIKRPWWAWICLTWTVVTILGIVFYVLKKIRII